MPRFSPHHIGRKAGKIECATHSATMDSGLDSAKTSPAVRPLFIVLLTISLVLGFGLLISSLFDVKKRVRVNLFDAEVHSHLTLAETRQNWTMASEITINPRNEYFFRF